MKELNALMTFLLLIPALADDRHLRAASADIPRLYRGENWGTLRRGLLELDRYVGEIGIVPDIRADSRYVDLWTAAWDAVGGDG